MGDPAVRRDTGFAKRIGHALSGRCTGNESVVIKNRPAQGHDQYRTNQGFRKR
jgi:hypothetical protein